MKKQPVDSIKSFFSLILTIFGLLIALPGFSQCKMNILNSSGGSATGTCVSNCTGADCVFKLTGPVALGRRTVLSFTNGTTTGGSSTVDDYVNLSLGFDQTFNVFFGCNDGGGDGLAFLFHGDPKYTMDDGETGGGLGFHVDGGANQVAIEFDTHQNDNSDLNPISPGDASWDNEVPEDHIALDCDGKVDNLCPGATVKAMPNMEDGLIHAVRIVYGAATNTLRVFYDGSLVYSVTIDLEAKFPGGVTWGWSGSTGSLGNETWVGWNNTSTPPCYTTNCNPASATTGACGTVTPVEFLKISAKEKKGEILVEWLTAQEVSNKKFVIEKSDAISAWHSIGEVPGAINSSEILKYDFTDLSPSAGINYYRIRQVDIDGKSSVSAAASVNFEAYILSVFPNPFKDKLEVQTIREILSVEVYNMQGVLIEKIFMPSSSSRSYNLDLENLISGNYLLKIIDKDFKPSLVKVIKK